MTFKSTFLFFILSYFLGWLLHLLSKDNMVFYIMGLYIYINIFTLFHPVIFKYGIMRPLQLSLSSVGLLNLFDSNSSMFVFSLIAVLTLIFIEKEDIYSFNSNFVNKKEKTELIFKRFVMAIIMPFSVTYVVLIFRPYSDIFSLLVVLLYFAALFVSAKWFDSIVSFGLFTLVQFFFFVYIIQTYMDWSSLKVTIFFISIFVFLLISYGRKGLSNYTSNIN